MKDLSPSSRTLIDRAGAPDGPSPEARARMKAALRAKLAAPATSSSAITAPKLVLLAALIGLGALAAFWWWPDGAPVIVQAPLRRPAAIEPSPAPMPAGAEPIATPPAPELRAPDEPAPEPRRAPRVRAAPPLEPAIEEPSTEPIIEAQVAPEPSALVTPASTLAAELALIREAQVALRRDDGGAALDALSRHAASFPTGLLREERDALRVVALCALGRRDEARAEARRFLERSPRSPHAARVRSACTGPTP